MANNIVAFVGVESFDTILYLSRILQRLGRNVLVVDNSETLALTYSIPQVSEMNTYTTIISYRRVDFTNMPVFEELAAKYDDILIDCGLKQPASSPNLFTKLIYVTDLFEYNIHRIKQIHDYYTCVNDKELLIRNSIYTKISMGEISRLIDQGIPSGKIALLNRDDVDYESSLNNHINKVFTLTLSRTYRNYLIRQVTSLCECFSRREIKEAYTRARNGD